MELSELYALAFCIGSSGVQSLRAQFCFVKCTGLNTRSCFWLYPVGAVPVISQMQLRLPSVQLLLPAAGHLTLTSLLILDKIVARHVRPITALFTFSTLGRVPPKSAAVEGIHASIVLCRLDQMGSNRCCKLLGMT
eukprot:5369526-Amphidinium_carterae.1